MVGMMVAAFYVRELFQEVKSVPMEKIKKIILTGVLGCQHMTAHCYIYTTICSVSRIELPPFQRRCF
jgi:hypothetical protein